MANSDEFKYLKEDEHSTIFRPFVSVIVPFYNIENCVDYCLNSLLTQSYDNFEVVCVNDGSTDNTARRLDAAADSDNRIRVFHKENEGVSVARNYGVEHSNGNWISFVDGDDIVSPDYLEYLVRAVAETGCKMTSCLCRRIYYNEAVSGFTLGRQTYRCDTFNRDQMAKKSLRGRIGPWGRLAPKEHYLKYPFPEGIGFEDIYMFCDHVLEFDSFAVIEEPLYGYVYRQGGVTKDKHPKKKKIEDYILAVNNLGGATGKRGRCN
ncbi:MAG: glycosyltransferase [Firmicutes bacterium]|nr:glycosyltransferase [Bacillota bacterium]